VTTITHKRAFAWHADRRTRKPQGTRPPARLVLDRPGPAARQAGSAASL